MFLLQKQLIYDMKWVYLDSVFRLESNFEHKKLPRLATFAGVWNLHHKFHLYLMNTTLLAESKEILF